MKRAGSAYKIKGLNLRLPVGVSAEALQRAKALGRIERQTKKLKKTKVKGLSLKEQARLTAKRDATAARAKALNEEAKSLTAVIDKTVTLESTRHSGSAISKLRLMELQILEKIQQGRETFVSVGNQRYKLISYREHLRIEKLENDKAHSGEEVKNLDEIASVIRAAAKLLTG